MGCLIPGPLAPPFAFRLTDGHLRLPISSIRSGTRPQKPSCTSPRHLDASDPRCWPYILARIWTWVCPTSWNLSQCKIAHKAINKRCAEKKAQRGQARHASHRAQAGNVCSHLAQSHKGKKPEGSPAIAKHGAPYRPRHQTFPSGRDRTARPGDDTNHAPKTRCLRRCPARSWPVTSHVPAVAGSRISPFSQEQAKGSPLPRVRPHQGHPARPGWDRKAG